MRRIKIASWLLTLAIIASTLCSCRSRSEEDRSVLLRSVSHPHGVILEHGSIFDQAVLDLGVHQRIVVPDTATIDRVKGGQQVRVYMKKTLDFDGFPGEPMTLRTARRNMGCAVKEDEKSLVLATFGEFDTKEGGAEIECLLLVPEGIEVVRQSGLSGRESAGNGGHRPSSERDTVGRWYGPTAPRAGWKELPARPDPERRANRRAP
jgi:hypothetical protein